MRRTLTQIDRPCEVTPARVLMRGGMDSGVRVGIVVNERRNVCREGKKKNYTPI